MEYKEWHYRQEKKDWPIGPWQKEPDKIQWQDNETGLPCLIVRGPSGALCGYVGVTEGHPMFGVGYDDLSPHPDVHGGLTFSDFCQFPAPARLIEFTGLDLTALIREIGCQHLIEALPSPEIPIKT